MSTPILSSKVKQQEEINKDLKYVRPHHSCYRTVKEKLKSVNVLHSVHDLFPVLNWLPKYSLRNDFLGDFISGFTVAIMHIPQGIGYAMLAQVPPIMGLYVAFFPVLIYFIFGTSRHNSMGTFAVACLMVGQTVLKHHEDPVEVATALCFMVGAWQLVMYIFRLGMVSALFSETLVSGFTTGAAIHVFTSQIKGLLGVRLQPVSGYFEVIITWNEIFHKLSVINWYAVGISAVAIIILILNNEVLKPIVAKKTKIPVAIELIVVVVGTSLSAYFHWNELGLKVMGNIPTGFPDFKVPRFDMMRQMVVDGFIIAIVTYSITVSMAMIYAQKYNYELSFNQELLAMGAGNIFGSFFCCLPVSASPSRSTVQATVGGKTQVASLVSCSILAVVLLWIGPLFEPLPACILSSIIVVALKGLLMQVKQICVFWKMSKLDACLWLGTFLSVIIISMEIGLLIGMILSVITIFLRGMRPYSCLLGNIPGTELYLDTSRYKTAVEVRNIKIFHFSGGLNFCTRSVFKEELYDLLDLEVTTGKLKFQHLIVDFSGLTYVDPSGVMFLKGLVNELTGFGVTVSFSGTPCPCYETMKKCGLLSLGTDKLKFFLSTHDAVIFAQECMQSVTCHI